MENRGLLFIPDISGFTKFVNETEIAHSSIIIQELLEILINANQIGLQVSEIEGDAILFYKPGDSPNLEEIYKQVEQMFTAFHRHIVAYEHRRFCQCDACRAAINLTLKVISHYGEFTDYHVQNFNKLIGKDIIVAHQLLKNDIEQHEYWLVTKNLLPDNPPSTLPQWMQWNSSAKQTENGEIPFRYTQLSQLKNEIRPEPLPEPGLSKKRKVFSLSREYDAGIIATFHATGDFNYRSRWQEGVKAVEEMDHFLPRLGTRCRCIMEDGQDIVYASSYSFHPERIEFSETDETNNTITYYILEKVAAKKTRLTIDYYISKNILQQILFNLNKKNKKEASMRKSMENLEALVREIRIPDEE